MSSTQENKPHALCIPAPAQGHINPMLKLAKILHSKGFIITFVNTEFNHQRLLKSLGSEALHDRPSFHFETISDGLPPAENPDATQDTTSLLKSLHEHGSDPFKNIISKVGALISPVTCIVADFAMGFTLSVAEEFRIPTVSFWTAGPGSLICYDQYPNLIQKGLMPLKVPGSMGSPQENKPHMVCMPAAAQGHINPMIKLAKIFHSKGFLITFVNTEFNHQRLLRSLGSDALDGFPSFHFEAIPDGLPPPENPDATQDTATTLKSLNENGLGPFKSVLTKVSALYSPVTCIVADFLIGSFPLSAAEEYGIPAIFFWTAGAGSLICYDQYPNLIQKGLMPLKDSSCLVNGYLDTVVDFIPTMPGIRLKDIPPFVRIVHPGDDFMVEFSDRAIKIAKSASAIVFNTFDELEGEILDALSLIFPPCYSIGPLHLLQRKIADKSLDSLKSNLWVEEPECLKWLDDKEPLSVIYVNFGSITVMTPQQLVEFCWGLAKSNYSFLWIVRPDLVIGDSAVLPSEFLEQTSNRGMLASWCPQEQVLSHPSIGGFLTHSGWNSTIESISYGVPMICWPFFADQQPNCWWSCNKWKIAMEIDNNVKSDEVSKLVIELMSGEKGKEMRKNAIDFKNKAEAACDLSSGSSVVNLEKVIHVLQASPK